MKRFYISFQKKYLPYVKNDRWLINLKTSNKLIDIIVASFDTKEEALQCLEIIQKNKCKTIEELKKIIKKGV